MGDYEAQVEAVEDRYSDRILAILARIRDAVRKAGLQCDNPEPTHGDRFEWSFGVGRTKPRDAFVNLSISEEPDYEGEGTGITFHLTILENGGRVLGEFSPFNFTPAVWIDVADDDAVEGRFALFESLDPAETAELLAAGLLV